jgi:hypothetical protein
MSGRGRRGSRGRGIWRRWRGRWRIFYSMWVWWAYRLRDEGSGWGAGRRGSVEGKWLEGWGLRRHKEK